jgi:hypothetical protein
VEPRIAKEQLVFRIRSHDNNPRRYLFRTQVTSTRDEPQQAVLVALKAGTRLLDAMTDRLLVESSELFFIGAVCR